MPSVFRVYDYKIGEFPGINLHLFFKYLHLNCKSASGGVNFAPLRPVCQYLGSPYLRGGLTEFFVESAAEIIGIVEAHLVSHLGNIQTGIGK